jgi:hypothetical protein
MLKKISFVLTHLVETYDLNFTIPGIRHMGTRNARIRKSSNRVPRTAFLKILP